MTVFFMFIFNEQGSEIHYAGDKLADKINVCAKNKKNANFESVGISPSVALVRV